MFAITLPDLVRCGPFPRPDELAASDSFRLLPALESIAFGEVGDVASGACDDEAEDRRRAAFACCTEDGKDALSAVGDMVKGPTSSLLPFPFDLGLVESISGTSSISIAVS